MTSAATKEDKNKSPKLPLTEDQKTAKFEILKAYGPKRRHLLTGYAGSGKTTLMQELTNELMARKFRVALTAPTHKAVAVLARKIAEAGIDVPCLTTYSLLSLEPHPDDNGRLIFKRRKYATPIVADVVIVDEASMISADLFEQINRYLRHCYVIYVGDPAQLPPVNERESLTFATKSRSHLTSIIRQAAGNPVLDAAMAIRATQDTDDMDWSWCKSATIPPRGVYLPGTAIDLWLQKAFKSSEFRDDNDTFRYLCYTNARVAQINAKVRNWLYGDTDLPFVPGEKALIRQPIIRDKTIVFATNEEAKVKSIKESSYKHEFRGHDGLQRWSVDIPTWNIVLLKDDGFKTAVKIPRDDDAVLAANTRLIDEASINRERWRDYYDFRGDLARLQAVYALTTHNSQGSTYKNAFVDIADIRRRHRDNPLEFKQLLYVAATRPTTGLYLVGV
jgi:hypothetical protein